MKRMLHSFYMLLTIITMAIVIIPLVHAENKIVCISDNGNLYGGIEPQSYYYKGENEGIYVVYSRLDRIKNNLDNDVDSFIRYYDFETDTVSEEYLVGRGHGDSHGAPTLCIDDRGFIHVFYGCHSDKMEYAVSTYSEDITSWTLRTDFLPDEFGYTYPKAVFANGSLYVFFRSRGHGGSSLNQGKYACIKSDDYGETWSKQIEFVDASNNEYAISVYPTTAKYANGYFHVTWYLMLESGPYSNYYGLRSNETQYNAYYAKSLDGVKWYNINESHTSKHITMHEMDKFYQVYNTTAQTKVIGQHTEDYSFIRNRTTQPPRMILSSSGIPYIGLRPTDDGGIIRYWNDHQWRTIHLPAKTSYIPFFVTKDISEIPVNALCYRNGKIYLTDYGYHCNDDQLRFIGRDTHKWNDETKTLDFIYHYKGPSLIFKEGISRTINSEETVDEITNTFSSNDNSVNDYSYKPVIQIILRIFERVPLLQSWFLRHFVL